jgi:hypothetical protein
VLIGVLFGIAAVSFAAAIVTDSATIGSIAIVLALVLAAVVGVAALVGGHRVVGAAVLVPLALYVWLVASRNVPQRIVSGSGEPVLPAFESGAGSLATCSHGMAFYCRERGLEGLARQFGVTTPEDAARALAAGLRGSRESREAAYRGCVRGLRGRRSPPRLTSPLAGPARSVTRHPLGLVGTGATALETATSGRAGACEGLARDVTLPGGADRPSALSDP